MPISRNLFRDFGKYNIVVMFITTLASNIVVGALIGYYLDKWTFKNGILLFIFIILGIVSGFYNGFKILLKETERYDKSEKVNKKDVSGDFGLISGFEKSWSPLLGSAGAVLNLFSLKNDIEKMASRGTTKGWVFGYLGRYTFSAALLLLGGLVSFETLLGVFFGLMNLKIVSFIAWRWTD